MRIARKLMLLAMLAIAATAVAAPSAFAQASTEPELHNQTPRLIVQQEVHAGGADVNCPLVTPSPPVSPPALPPTTAGGGCRAHVTSGAQTIVLSNHDAAGAEAVVSVCGVEFDIRVDVAGEGYITHQEFTGAAGTCNVRPCGQTAPGGEGRIWSFWMQENEIAGNPVRERGTALFCVVSILGGPDSHCEVSLPMSQPTTHRYRFTAVNVGGHAPAGTTRCELDGTLDVEATPGTSGEALAEQNIEIRHN
jgi:hypothetical protein